MRRFLPCRRRARRAALGQRGERAAARALRRRGYRLLARNLRTPQAEVDLLAREGGCLVVVEVKTARPSRDGAQPGAGAIPGRWSRQGRRLHAAARGLAGQPAFRTGAGAPAAFRVDLALVTLDGRRALVTIRRDVWRRRAGARTGGRGCR